ncbi:MAG: T9SS type A sorting domain-containing protein [Crocinitomicaceae bacterium]|nr:T9SS type A sorting domain-containing protein [Crocinitomicaceae bacterium]
MRPLLLILFCLFGLTFHLTANHQWQQIADFGNFGRHRATGMGIGNKAYCGTGHLNGTGFDTWYADWWEYDPATNAWTQKTDYPGNNGNGDQDVVSVSIGNVGYAGMGQMDGNGFYKYDPVVNLWTQVTSPPATASFNNSFPFKIGDKGYFPSIFSTAFYEYDPALDVWTQRSNIPFSTSFGVPTFAIGDKGYIKNAANFWEYDPVTDLWTPKAPFPGTSPHRPAGIGQYNYGFFIGGFAGNPSALPWIWAPEVWRYDPLVDTWEQLEDFPGTTRRWAVAMNIGDDVYYGLGTNGTNFNDFWRFNSLASEEQIDLDSFKVYPMPASDYVNIKSANYLNYTMHLYAVDGTHVLELSTTNGAIKIQRDNLPSGSYFYKIQVDGTVIHSDKIIFR